MSTPDDIEMAQNSLGETFKRMAELEAQLNSDGPAKDTSVMIAEDFRTFTELMFVMLSLLRKEINKISRTVDVLKTRYRRNALTFLGVPEGDKEDCSTLILTTIHKMEN